MSWFIIFLLWGVCLDWRVTSFGGGWWFRGDWLFMCDVDFVGEVLNSVKLTDL